MSAKTPAEKMRVKPGMKVARIGLSAELEGLIGIPEGAELVTDPGTADVLFLSARTRAESEERLTATAPRMSATARMWIAYPKGAKAAGLDVSRDTIMTFAPSVGLMANANIAVDETWSSVGLRRA